MQAILAAILSSPCENGASKPCLALGYEDPGHVGTK